MTYEMIAGYLRGFGISMVPAVLTMLGVCGVRIVWVYTAFAANRTFDTLLLAYPLSLAVTAALLLIRPVSGSGALAVGSELMASHGPDSYIGRCAAVMLGCTETTFYTIAVYFGAAGIRRTRYTIPAALTADLAGFMAAAWSVRLFFGA